MLARKIERLNSLGDRKKGEVWRRAGKPGVTRAQTHKMEMLDTTREFCLENFRWKLESPELQGFLNFMSFDPS